MLTIAHVYPELLGTYGDGGNVEVLQARMQWRGLPVAVERVALGEPLPAATSLVVLGGGEDEAQVAAAERVRDLLAPVAGNGVVVFAVCAGLQLVGESFETGAGKVIPGAGLLDARSQRSPKRAVGEVVADVVELDLPPLTGFTNHGGATVLGPDARPLGRVRRGAANHPLTRDEGAVQGSVIATYLHGPVLARNPALADHLLELATGEQLAALPDGEVAALRRERLAEGRFRRA